jgi:hypothetical protein
MSLDLVPLTPSQLVEISGCDEGLVAAWIAAYMDPPASVKNPVGWFLAGVRSGTMPVDVVQSVEARELARAVHVAEAWIRNVGAIVEEHELVDALFGASGILEHWSHDDALRARMLERWKARRRA